MLQALSQNFYVCGSTLTDDLKIITEDEPMLIEVLISKSEHVLPMIPAGLHNDEMIGLHFTDENEEVDNA